MKWIVEEVINSWDPINLLPHAPDDEYEEEIASIVLLLQNESDIQKISQGIQNIFIESFGKDIFKNDYEQCLAIARSILEKL